METNTPNIQSSLPPEQPKPTNVWFDKKHIITYVIVLIGFAVIGGAIYAYQKQADTRLGACVIGCDASKKSDIPSNWKTYTDQQYGFQFDYPPDWTIGGVKAFGYVAKVNNPDKPKFNDVLHITVQDSKGIDNSNVSSYYGDIAGHKAYVYCLLGCAKETNKTRLNGQALIVQNLPTNSMSTVLNYNAITVPLSEAELKNIELIISSIRLVKLSDTSGQKIYKNSDFDFQFSYPSNYSITSDISNSNGTRVVLERNDKRGMLIIDATPKDKARSPSGSSVNSDVSNPLLNSKYVAGYDPTASVDWTYYYGSNSSYAYTVAVTHRYNGYTDLEIYLKEARDIIETFKVTQ